VDLNGREDAAAAAPEDSLRAGDGGVARHRPTVMCIEHRLRQQNLLRDYLSQRGFRVLVLNDVHRGLKRLQTDPPNCVLLMGESIGDHLSDVFQQTAKMAGSSSFTSIVVLAEHQADLKQQLVETSNARILVQPVSLRDLRREIHLAIQRKIRSSGEGAAPSQEAKRRADAS